MSRGLSQRVLEGVEKSFCKIDRYVFFFFFLVSFYIQFSYFFFFRGIPVGMGIDYLGRQTFYTESSIEFFLPKYVFRRALINSVWTTLRDFDAILLLEVR